MNGPIQLTSCSHAAAFPFLMRTSRLELVSESAGVGRLMRASRIQAKRDCPKGGCNRAFMPLSRDYSNFRAFGSPLNGFALFLHPILRFKYLNIADSMSPGPVAKRFRV